MSKVVFKENNQYQPSLFPFSFDSYIDKNHPVRILDKVIDNLDISEILQTYKGGGTSSYHPSIMLKIIIYGYLNNLYSSRKIEKASKENVHFIWLSGENFPDHNTINNFRKDRLKEQIENIFTQVVIMLSEMKVLSFKESFTDGTKIESAANRYTFVWRGSVEKNKQKLESKIQLILEEINQAIEEDKHSGEEKESTTGITSEELNKKIKELNNKLSEIKASKNVIKKVENLEKESLTKLQEYETHLKKMGKRNSYSKTDEDATFMRMKEDHMKNGQLKPAYNVQVSTENNFITNFGIYQNPGDTTTLISHLLSYQNKYNCFPEKEITDAGYGSLENYDFIEENGIENFVKFNWFHKEQSNKFKNDISKVENLYYNEEKDFFVCPIGQQMHPISTSIEQSKSGYKYEVTHYQAKNCKTCPLNGACHKQKGNRIIEINKRLRAHKQKVRGNLLSDIGIKLRGRRSSEVEQTFGQIKWNKKFNRFLLRGLDKVKIEFGLIAIAHNLQKLHRLLDLGLIVSSFKLIFNIFLNFTIFSKSQILLVIRTIINNRISFKHFCENMEIKKAA